MSASVISRRLKSVIRCRVMADKPKIKEEPLPRWLIEARKRWESEGDPDHVKATTSANWIEKTKDPIGG